MHFTHMRGFRVPSFAPPAPPDTSAGDGSAFRLWFEAQHGQRPGGPVTDIDLIQLRDKGRSAEAVIAARDRYDARMQSALYAWSIADANKDYRKMRKIVAPNTGIDGKAPDRDESKQP